MYIDTTLLTNTSLEWPSQSIYSKMVIDCTTVRDAFEGLLMSVDKWTPSITCCVTDCTWEAKS